MALQGTFEDERRPSPARRALVVATTDRARAFASARRHTTLVRALRFILPIAALASLASYGLGMRVNLKIGNGTLQSGPVSISSDNLSMANPRYEGFNKDGSKFTVTAKSASQDIRAKGPVQLDQIDGRMVQANNGVVTLTSPRGAFDNVANQLELMDEIKIRSDDGMRADLTQATIYLKDNRIVSTQPVAIDMKAGQIRANQMELLQSARQAMFSNGVMTRLKPEPKPAGAPAKTPGAPTTAAPRMIGATDGPIDVASQTLQVDDAKMTAVFSGDVVAKQGDASLRTAELVAFYDGAPVALPGVETAGTPAGEPSGKLKRLVAKSSVTMTTATDRVTSDSAEFDAEKETALLLGHVVMNSGVDRRATSDRVDLDSKADTALLTGNVVVNQDKNLLRGGKLFVDRKSATTKLWSPADATHPAGRIAARFFQSTSPANSKTQVKKAVAATANEAGGFVFRTDSTAPIDIDAETLDVLDKSKTATFRGAVHAVQGDFTIRTLELVATYSGEAGLAAGGTDPKAGGSAQLTKIRANQKVEVTSGVDQSATGDWAEFDTKSNTVTIGGNVALKKGSSVAYAPKAIIDMTTGITYLERDVKSTGPAISPSPTEQRAPYTLPDLPKIKPSVVAPVAPAFGTDPRACPPGKMCLKVDPKDGLTTQNGAKPAAKAPWQTETAPPPQKQKAPSNATSGWTSSAQPSN